jgi:protein TonB
MIHERTFLGRSLALSLILHAAAFAVVAQLAARAPRIWNPLQRELTVSLRELPAPEAPLPAPAELLPQKPPRNPNPAALLGATPMATSPGSPPRISGEAALRAAGQLKGELLYPRVAVERGLQGEALVLLFLDAAGTVAAARLEASSGHPLLDEAAVRAARTLRGLPDSAPRDVLLPVRFRLR